MTSNALEHSNSDFFLYFLALEMTAGYSSIVDNNNHMGARFVPVTCIRMTHTHTYRTGFKETFNMIHLDNSKQSSHKQADLEAQEANINNKKDRFFMDFYIIRYFTISHFFCLFISLYLPCLFCFHSDV